MKVREPQIRSEGELRLVGLKRRLTYFELQTVAVQWQQFMSTSYGGIENKIAEPPFGITMAADDAAIDYVCAAGVTKFGEIPQGCIKLTIPPANYAVFAHDGHVTAIRETYVSIFNEWFPQSDKRAADAPGFERHNPTFDPRSGNGGVAIWLPIQ